ncbi:hypothetical protein LCGC14_2624000, partial [marine sediment metagenome]
MILTRRKFLQRIGYMMVGGLIVPCVPKVFYSIPAPKIQPLYSRAFSVQEIARWFNISPMMLKELPRTGTFSRFLDLQHDYVINCIRPW